ACWFLVSSLVIPVNMFPAKWTCECHPFAESSGPMNFRSRLSALILLPLFALDLQAQSVWNGGGLANTNWSDTANWASGTLPPNNFTGSIDYTSASAFTSTVDTSFSLYSLTIFNGAGALILNNSGG